MTSRASPVRPPRAAAWLVELFASPQEADGILGDLAEELTASAALECETDARRRYRRHAWRTIRDLALSQSRTRPWASAAIGLTGLILVTGIGPAGGVITGPTNLVASALMARYPAYFYVHASLVSEIVLVLPALIIGFFIALLARTIGFRPMSAALAFVLAMAILNAIDMPTVMLLLGQPTPPHFTVVHWLVRWTRGLLEFGGAATIGAAVGRLSTVRLSAGLPRQTPQRDVG